MSSALPQSKVVPQTLGSKKMLATSCYISTMVMPGVSFMGRPWRLLRFPRWGARHRTPSQSSHDTLQRSTSAREETQSPDEPSYAQLFLENFSWKHWDTLGPFMVRLYLGGAHGDLISSDIYIHLDLDQNSNCEQKGPDFSGIVADDDQFRHPNERNT